MKHWIALLALALLGAGGYFAWNHWQKARLTAEAPSRPTTAPAELRDIAFAVNAAGEITPAEQVSVRPEINGKIEQLPVDIGDRVKKGALLFKLDDRELQQERSSNLTDIEKARLGLEKAQRDFRRAQQLLADRLISQELFDDTKTAYDLAQERARARPARPRHH
jgi:RND family efflux transporter MFP subunit